MQSSCLILVIFSTNYEFYECTNTILLNVSKGYLFHIRTFVFFVIRRNFVELMGFAPMSKSFNSKSSTSLVYFSPPERRLRYFGVGNKQNLQVSFSELFCLVRLKNRRKLFHYITPRSALWKITRQQR